MPSHQEHQQQQNIPASTKSSGQSKESACHAGVSKSSGQSKESACHIGVFVYHFPLLEKVLDISEVACWDLVQLRTFLNEH